MMRAVLNLTALFMLIFIEEYRKGVIMEEDKKLIRIYTGSEISAMLLKAELEEMGVSAMTQNDNISGIESSFVGNVRKETDLYIYESDYSKVEELVAEFVDRNKE